MFSEGDPYVGIDVDNCRDQRTGALNEIAQNIVQMLQSYTEISPSGTGIHIFCRGTLPPGARRKGTVEMYNQGRYFTVTMNHLPGTPVTTEARTAELAVVHAKYITPSEKQIVQQNLSLQTVMLSDSELLQKIRSSKTGQEFSRLWNGDSAKYGGDQSAADQAICNMLAFWTGRDIARMDSLFRQSRLYRDKWDKVHFADGRTYGAATLQKAIADCKSTYALQLSRIEEAAPAEMDFSRLKYFRCTDAGNAERLHFLYGGKIRYCYAYKGWFIFDGKRWALDKAGQIIEMAKATMRETKIQAEGNESLGSWCNKSESKAKLTALIDLAQSLVPILPEELDADRWLLNCQNGVVNLRTGQLLAHSPSFMISKICNSNFTPEQAEGLWSEVARSILPDDETRRFVQRFAGYSLTGSVREEKFMVANGDGANGKGTLIETLGTALGDYCETLAVEILLQSKNTGNGNEPSPELAKLPGVRFLMASETGQGRVLDESRVKAITGGDRITARRLRCDPFTYDPQFKLWLSTNHVPRVRGDDDGIWRRFRLVQFAQKFEGRNRQNGLKEELRKPENLAAALSWAVQGCLAWQLEGLNEPASILQATRNFQLDCDVIGQFIDSECNVGAGYLSGSKMLYRSFKYWCEENGREPHNSSNFSLMMENKGFKKSRNKSGMWWSGLETSGVVM